jgi:hypothetical protein
MTDAALKEEDALRSSFSALDKKRMNVLCYVSLNSNGGPCDLHQTPPGEPEDS